MDSNYICEYSQVIIKQGHKLHDTSQIYLNAGLEYGWKGGMENRMERSLYVVTFI